VHQGETGTLMTVHARMDLPFRAGAHMVDREATKEGLAASPLSNGRLVAGKAASLRSRERPRG
jgi:hypothetical protein